MNRQLSPIGSERTSSVDLAFVMRGLGALTATLLGAHPTSGRVTGAEFYEAITDMTTGDGILLLVPSAMDLKPGILKSIAGRASQLNYAGIALKCSEDEVGAVDDIAQASGIPFIRVEDRVSWRLFEALVSRVLGEQRRSEDAHLDKGAEPLFSIANELAAYFGGSVAIEDLGRRIVAYSSLAGQHIDEMRTQGILSREVPSSPFNDDQYRTLLRSDIPIKYPQMGEELPRVTFAIRAGTLPLGSIWAIDAKNGDDPITEEQIVRVRSAAAMAAAHMLDDLRVREAGQLPREGYLRTLLIEGEAVGSEFAALGVPEERGAALLVFDLGPAEHHTTVAQLRSAVQRHLVFRHPEVVTIAHHKRVYALITDDSEKLSTSISPLVSILNRLLSVDVRVALPGVAYRPGSIAILRERADALFETAARRPELAEFRVLTVHRLRPHLVYERHAAMLEAESELAHPGVEKLTQGHPELAITLRVWCESQGRIAHAARELGVHENTVRFRVQKAADIASLNLGDPDTVLTVWLQLRASDRLSDERAGWPKPSSTRPRPLLADAP